MATSQTTDDATTAAQKMYIRQRISKLEEKIEKEADYRAFGATSEVDFKMSEARLDGYRKEIEGLEDLLEEL